MFFGDCQTKFALRSGRGAKTVPKVHWVTFGCKVNQYDTQRVREALEQAGYMEAHTGETPDLCVVNTCTVTHEADAQARQMIRRLARQWPHAGIVVMGCYAHRDPEAFRRLPNVVAVVAAPEQLTGVLQRFGVERLPAGITRFERHARAFVKVQDGCLLNCTFCIIPKVRPTLCSRPIEDIEAEVRRLVDGGYREIVLTGIHLGHYGIDLSRGEPKERWTRLWHVLRRLSVLPGEFRIRLSSLEAAEMRRDLLEAIVACPRICPHFHLCLQSGSDRILQLMRRRYRVDSFLRRCEELRKFFECPAITTDIIVGFPGESDADFEKTLQIARLAGFAWMHVFPFSPRKGTPAAHMPDRVPPHLLRERKERILRLNDELARAYAAQLLGRTLEVLVERQDPRRPGLLTGTACRKVHVSFDGPVGAIGQLVQVRAETVDGTDLIGQRVTEAAPNWPLLHDLAATPTGAALPVVASPGTN
ncbi:MAG: tRNA (N(6)-L-threonylcarbamoyladenosine(37)-C(2))-methylthiotransferase MtaB [Gemmataceae bacterium]